MPDVTMELDTAQASAYLRSVYSDQLPFALSSAINKSATGGQAVQREHQREIFDVRRPMFVDRAVKISKFARKADDVPEARMRIEPPGGRKRADVIDKFETESLKRPRFSDALWVPTDNVTVDGIVMKGWRPRQLKFQKWGHGPKARVLRGRRKTFMIRYNRAAPEGLSRNGMLSGLIFERDGPDLTLLYTRHATVPIKPELHFQDNIRRHVLDNWDANFLAAFDRAARTVK